MNENSTPDLTPTYESHTPDAWLTAARLLVRWISERVRVDELLSTLPSNLGRSGRARCQNLVFGALRHMGRIEDIIAPLMSHPPRTEVRAVFLLAGFELIEGGGDGHVPKVAHHAVEQTKRLASQPEARMVNAIVRKLATALAEEQVPGRLATAPRLARYYSHPVWMVERWLAQFGAESTRSLLEWNLRPAPIYARWRRTTNLPPPPCPLTHAVDGFL